MEGERNLGIGVPYCDAVDDLIVGVFLGVAITVGVGVALAAFGNALVDRTLRTLLHTVYHSPSQSPPCASNSYSLAAAGDEFPTSEMLVCV